MTKALLLLALLGLLTQPAARGQMAGQGVEEIA